VRVQFVQELHNYDFLYVVSLKNGVPVYESNDPGGNILKYLKKGEQLEAVDELQWTPIGDEYIKLISVKFNDKGEIGYVTAENVALFQNEGQREPRLGIRKTVISSKIRNATVVIEHHDLIVLYNDTFYIKNHGYIHRSDYFTRFLIEDLSYMDRNGDNEEEIIVRGMYDGGYFFSDGFEYKVEMWNRLDSNLQHIFYFTYSGGGLLFSDWIHDGEFKLLDTDQDGFLETIRATKRELYNMEEVENQIWVNTVTYRKWIEDTYVVTAQFPVIGTTTGDNLRVRSIPSLDGTIEGKLKKGEPVYIVDRSPLPMTINNNTSYWYQIINKHGLSGWSFGQYLLVPAKREKLIPLDEFKH
jgi:uncharacterized protein YgiM (DUF1202 family)